LINDPLFYVLGVTSDLVVGFDKAGLWHRLLAS